jgi:hypothetical protein
MISQIKITFSKEQWEFFEKLHSGKVIGHIDSIQPRDVSQYFYTLMDLGWADWVTEDVFYRYFLTDAGHEVYNGSAYHVVVEHD